MHIKVSIAILILLSFFNIGAISNDIYNTKNLFNNLENNIVNISEFEENGVKLQYKTKENIEKEISRIKENLIKYVNGSCKKLEDNEYEISTSDFKIDIKMWDEGNYNYAEISLINKNSKYSTMDLRRVFEKLETNKMEDKQYFLYYKGKDKSIDKNYMLDKLKSVSNLQQVKYLKINNGYAGTGYLNDGGKVNFALMEYNTGSHIVIGTPIIFTTY